MFLNMRYMRKTHARILDASRGEMSSYHAFSQQRRLPVLSDLFVVWSGVHVSCTSHQLDRSRSPKMHCIHLLVIILRMRNARVRSFWRFCEKCQFLLDVSLEI